METEGQNRWAAFFVSHSGRLTSYVRGRLWHAGGMDAEDIVADVMVSLLNRPDTSGPVENIAAYAYRAVRNKIADYRRQKARTVSLDAFVDGGGELPFLALVSGREDVSGEAERRELLRRLGEAIGRLEPRRRAVLIATEMGGKSFRELSEEWGEPMGTLLSRKCRAVKELREMLRDWKE